MVANRGGGCLGDSRFFLSENDFVGDCNHCALLLVYPRIKKTLSIRNGRSGRFARQGIADFENSNDQKLVRRTRFVMYFGSPLTCLLIQYGLGTYDNPAKSLTVNIVLLVVTLIIFEISIIVMTEIYFKILYKSVLAELKNLLSELEIG